jgi:hypothetical protein
MKYLLLFPVLALAFFASSCRTIMPMDPMTHRQSCKCAPGYFNDPGPEGCVHVIRSTK